MIKLTIPQFQDSLFETVLVPTDAAENGVTREVGEGDLKIFLSKRNRIAIGIPYYENLVSRILATGEKLSHEVEQMIKDNYDFHYVSLSCSFLPDKDCKFIWARFGVELTAESAEERPIAHDMMPSEVLTKVLYKREGTLSRQLKFGMNKLGADLKVGNTQAKEYVVYEPEIISYGINRPDIAWDFRSTQEKGIWGNKTGLNLVIRAPKDCRIQGKFLVGAEVETYLGKLVRIPLTKAKESIADAVYHLSK